MFYVIDASVYVFRAWFSIPDDMQDADGNPVLVQQETVFQLRGFFRLDDRRQLSILLAT